MKAMVIVEIIVVVFLVFTAGVLTGKLITEDTADSLWRYSSEEWMHLSQRWQDNSERFEKIANEAIDTANKSQEIARQCLGREELRSKVK